MLFPSSLSSRQTVDGRPSSFALILVPKMKMRKGREARRRDLFCPLRAKRKKIFPSCTER